MLLLLYIKSVSFINVDKSIKIYRKIQSSRGTSNMKIAYLVLLNSDKINTGKLLNVPNKYMYTFSFVT